MGLKPKYPKDLEPPRKPISHPMPYLNSRDSASDQCAIRDCVSAVKNPKRTKMCPDHE